MNLLECGVSGKLNEMEAQIERDVGALSGEDASALVAPMKAAAMDRIRK